jgi:hypothetical protein
MHPRGQHVREHAIAVELVLSAHSVKCLLNPREAPTLVTTGNEGFHFAHADVLEETESAARRRKSLEESC